VIWPWNLFLPLALGASSVALGIGFYFAQTWTRRIVLSLLLPLGVAVVLTLVFTLISGDGYASCFILFGTLLWAYVGLPVGIILGFLFRLIR
jgi:hypothetical protein